MGRRRRHRRRKARERKKKEQGLMVETKPSHFRIIRINRESTPSVPTCSAHPALTLKEAPDVLVIHKEGDRANAQYFCVPCQKELLERLLRDWLNFPGLRERMGSVGVPVALLDALMEHHTVAAD